MRTQRIALAALWLVMVGGLVFGPALPNGFHLDDQPRVQDNVAIRSVWPLHRHFIDPSTFASDPNLQNFRPLVPLTFSLDYALYGLSLRGFHLTNLAAHLTAALLVFFLVGELTRARDARAGDDLLAIVVATVFAVHPVAGVVVNYLSARDLALMQMFLVAALAVHTRLRRSGRDGPWLSLPALLSLLSLCGKTNAAIMPALVFALEFQVLEPGAWRNALRRAAPYALVDVVFFAYVRLVLGFNDLTTVVSPSIGISSYAAVQLYVHARHYLGELVWPWSLRMMPELPRERLLLEPWFWAGAAVATASLMLAWTERRRNPLASFCLVAYWIVIVPESSIVPLIHPHMPYRPYPALPFVLIWATAAAFERLGPRPTVAVMSLFTVWCACASLALNATWRTNETLWTHTLAHGGNYWAHMYYAGSLSDPKDPRVVKHLRESVRLARSEELTPTYKLGLALVQTGEVEQGLSLLEKAVRRRPAFSIFSWGLGVTLSDLGRHREALPHLDRAVALAPGLLNFRFSRAVVHIRAGDLVGALPDLDLVSRTSPGYGDVDDVRGQILERLGKREQAIAAYRSQLATGHARPAVRERLFALGAHSP